MDEYKQLKESLNRVPDQRQHDQNAFQLLQEAAIKPEVHIHEAQQATGLDQPHKDEPAHHVEDHHEHHESRVTGGNSACGVSMKSYESNYLSHGFVLSWTIERRCRTSPCRP